jgi:hypothetical protein
MTSFRFQNARYNNKKKEPTKVRGAPHFVARHQKFYEFRWNARFVLSCNNCPQTARLLKTVERSCGTASRWTVRGFSRHELSFSQQPREENSGTLTDQTKPNQPTNQPTNPPTNCLDEGRSWEANVPWPVKKFPAFYGPRWFTAVLSYDARGHLAKWCAFIV